jgi:large subunit ribosomal protein L24
MKKIKTNDTVIVIAGKDCGKQGQVLQVCGARVVVAGVNLVKKHQKPDPNRNKAAAIIAKEAPLHISNVALLHPKTQKASKVVVEERDGKKVRIFKTDGALVDA